MGVRSRPVDDRFTTRDVQLEADTRKLLCTLQLELSKTCDAPTAKAEGLEVTPHAGAVGG